MTRNVVYFWGDLRTKKQDDSGNSRNGKGHKTIKCGLGEMETETLRDHKSTFPPQIGFKRLHRVDPLDEAVMVLHAKGMTTRDTQTPIKELARIDI